ncbi:hypothetical protein ZTR_09137 [Talaromyces verruculosus]|nr:hypothetical protein ZTR_09137 [Talaromyces verruculosus]
MAGQQYAHGDYTIGWICALPKTELVAAAAMLDEEHPILPAADSQDTNSYLLGRIGDHNVVIACLPAETTGKVSAATVAIDMIRSFPSIRFGMMVGIGGGVPRYFYPERGTADETLEDDFDEWDEELEEVSDIRLGDVVVSLHTKSSEAVVQYDFGKSLQEEDFIHTGGKLNKPPRIVLNAVSQLQANHIRGHQKIPGFLSKMLTNNPAMIRFQHPGMETDRLFRPDVVHIEGRKSCRDCYGLNDVNIVQRSGRSDTAPRIYYGTIGSADQVMKDAILRDQWALKENILCFEMEAAGLMDSFPCLVVRGICDYADSHKNKVWQSYAAATAAAYAKELLLVIPGQGLTKLSPIKQLLHVSEQVEAVNSSLEKAYEQREDHHHDQIMRYLTEDYRRCHQVFKTSTYEKFKNINPNRVEGTCDWVLKSPEYMRWWNATSNDLLWISADPGCGKSVLTKSLIDEVFIASDSNVSIVYFFFKDNDEQNNLAIALCAVLHQLFSLQPQLLRHALPFWERNKEKIQYEVDDMWRIFMAVKSDPEFEKTICVFDAFDECRVHDQKALIKKLGDFHNRATASHQNWLKFLVTSRPYDEIQDQFRPVTDCFPEIRLRGEEENDQIHKEINLVVKVKMAELGKDLGLRADTQERLKRELCEMEHRTYLWLHLAINDIRTTLKNSLRPDCETIPPLPKNVPDAYGRILDRIPSEQQAKVKTILRIVVGARRPLTIQEMAMALGVATTPCAETAIDAGLSPKGLDTKIRQLCGLFVFIKESKIYLIHQTAREFLVSKHDRSSNMHWHLEQRQTELQMTKICVKYLLLNDLVSNEEDSVRSLLDYSAENWADHFRNVLCPEADLVNCVWRLYDVTMKLFGLWFPIFWNVAMPYRRDPKMKAFHLAAFNGHPEILCGAAMNNAGEIDRVDGSGTTSLQWACERGHSEIVQVLIELGADVNAQGGDYGNALQTTAERGHLDIAHLLLEQGADVNAQGGRYGNALQAAAQGGYLNIIQLLLEKGADINAQGGRYNNALQAAARGGHLDIVMLLLEKRVNVNAQGGDYGNALQAAARGGHLDIVQLLHKKGANINAQGGYYGNALQAAAQGGHLYLIQLLLEKGANINAQGGEYGTALCAAAEGGYLEAIRLLLEKGANVNAKGGNYGNALYAAAEGGYLEAIKLLLEKGANVNAKGGNYGNAFQAAAQGGHLEIIQLLLDKGADVDVEGEDYGNALQAAAQRGHLDIVQLLLELRTDLNAQGDDYDNALQTAAQRGHLDIVQLLLQKGADVNAKDGHCGNALQAATQEGHLDIVQLLIDNGADVNAQGPYYSNALQAAAEGGYLGIVHLLLENGADVNAEGGYYSNALHAAAQRGHLDIVQLLLEMGADVNAQGGRYGNTLQATAQGGYLDIIQLLLEKGADVNARGGYYSNALQAAAQGGYLDIVKLLLDKGADINAQGGYYGNALPAAAQGGYLDIVLLLLEKGADVNAHGGDDGNALYTASEEGYLDIVQLLVEKGADVNAQGGYYDNALQAAAQGGHFVIVQILLENGADVNAHGGEYRA